MQSIKLAVWADVTHQTFRPESTKEPTGRPETFVSLRFEKEANAILVITKHIVQTVCCSPIP